jgi:phosphatidylinositol 4-kinase
MALSKDSPRSRKFLWFVYRFPNRGVHSPANFVDKQTIRELEILLALAKSSPNVTQQDHALRLVSQLAEYLPESHSQVFQASPFLLDVESSPWEELTRSLTEALLSLTSNHASVREFANKAIIEYFSNYTHAIREARLESTEILILTVSLVGFVEGASRFTHVWTATEKSGIIQYLQDILSEGFLVAVETAASKLRNQSTSDSSLREWRKCSRRYASQGRPLGSMLLQQAFTGFIKSCTTTTVLGSPNLDDYVLFNKYNSGYTRAANYHDDDESSLVQSLTSIIADKVQFLQDGADYLQIGSTWQQGLAFSTKASTLVAFLNCTILDPDAADTDLLLSWLEDTVTDTVQMANSDLATTVLSITAATARLYPAHASNLSQSLLKFIVQGNTNASVASVAADCLTKVLNILSQDSVITTLYSLGNALSPAAVNDDRNGQLPAEAHENNSTLDTYYSNAESVISLPGNSEEETAVTHRNVIHTIVNIAVGCADENLTALAQSMLLQKIGKINIIVDAYIIQETAKLVLASRHTEFQLLLKFYARLYQEGTLRGHSIIVDAVHNARLYISCSLNKSPSHFRIYLVHLLERIISKGDVTDIEHHKQKDVSLSPNDITPFLKPLGLLLSWESETMSQLNDVSYYDEDTAALFRDAWFNIAVHGISFKSEIGKRYRDELRAIAAKSPSLVPENRAEILESDVELNIILRRAVTPQRTTEQKKLLSDELPERESDIKRLSYQQVIFLNASLLIETLRASRGDCNKILLYFLDPTLNSSEMGNCMAAIADKVVTTYLSITLTGKAEDFSAPNLSNQLAEIFVYCCHRIHRVQEVALSCASKIISTSPSSLCDRKSLFVLFDLLTIMWSSCLENELDEFGWKSTFRKGNVQVELSDNYDSRKRTLASFRVQARNWVTIAINLAPLDVKGLLQVSRIPFFVLLVNLLTRIRRTFLKMRMTTSPMDASHLDARLLWRWWLSFPRAIYD